jgi:site-specific recombinase XerD
LINFAQIIHLETLRNYKKMKKKSSKSTKNMAFSQLMFHLVSELESAKQFRTAQNYRNCLKNFSLFCENQDLKLTQLTHELIVNYQHFLRARNNCFNTCSFYMRILRAVYNKAVKSGFVSYKNLFSNVYTGIAKTEKRAVAASIIQDLKRFELKNRQGLAFSRDLFLLSFYFRGMAFVDLAKIRKTDVQNGIIRYTRSKTKQDLRIKIEPCAKEILDRYSCEKSDRLLPIFEPVENSLKAYENALRLHNKRLLKLSKMLNLQHSLSSYVARHTWATLAKKSGVELVVISEALGHNSIVTTQIYLDSLDQDRIDDANFLVISMIG